MACADYVLFAASRPSRRVPVLPEKKTIDRAKRDKRQGKSPSTQAGEFVRETIDHIRQGKHGARSTKQAIAIGLSKARRAGVDLPPPAKGKASAKTRRNAQAAYRAGHSREDQSGTSGEARHGSVNLRRSRAATKALQREGGQAASTRALSRQASRQASKRSAADRSASAEQAAQTRLAHQTPAKRKVTARKAARTRKAHSPGARRRS